MPEAKIFVLEYILACGRPVKYNRVYLGENVRHIFTIAHLFQILREKSFDYFFIIYMKNLRDYAEATCVNHVSIIYLKNTAFD